MVREARQIAELLRQVVAGALQLRQQSVQRVELFRVALLECHQTCVQRRARVADILDRSVQALDSFIEKTARAEILLE